MPPRRACARPGCLGHPVQRTVQVLCARCGQAKFAPDPLIPLDDQGFLTGPPIPLVLPYTCHRCRAVLARRNAVDPKGSEGQREALKTARLRQSYTRTAPRSPQA